MKKHYFYIIISVLAITILQAVFIKSLYDNYIVSETEQIERAMSQAINLELYLRNVEDLNDIKYELTSTPISKMTQTMLDSIIKYNPIPENPQKNSYNVKQLMNEGIITLSYEITGQIIQDNFFNENKPINLNLLDSLFDNRLKNRIYTNKFTVYNRHSIVLDSIGNDNTNYNYTSQYKQLGLKGYQFIQLKSHIQLSYFIKQSIWILILSLLTISVPIISLLYQLTTIRKRTKQIESSEKSINSTIHDLKSPLSSTSIVLDLCSKTESDPDKKELIQSSLAVVSNLIRNIDSLLNITRYNKKKIVIYKERVTEDWILQTIEVIKNGLKLNYPDKTNNVSVVNDIPANKELYLDKMHFENIVRNLVENAMKYSDNDVVIQVVLGITNADQLKITVKDSGWGISKKHLKHLFKHFYRVPTANNEIKGHGIGLSSVKSTAIAHNGGVSVRSTQYEGSEFEVKLNIEK